MKSNITIRSNIYIRAHRTIQGDFAFVAQIIGKTALETLKARDDGSIKLSPWQKRTCTEDTGCSNARNGEMTHGLVRKNGELVWEGRCEYRECEIFDTCKETANFDRNAPKKYQNEEESTVFLTYEWLGDTEKLFESQEVIETQITEEIVPEEAIIADIKAFTLQDEYEKLDNPVKIIEADVSSKILVNAAPGSGKTYTAIRRIEHIICNQLVEDLSGVLVLVYTNAAKNEILSRLEAGIIDGSLAYSARNIDVASFDSLATSYLATIEENYAHLDYNGRIKLFNERFDKDDFSNFEYVIIDELQDLVNERAKMTLNILSALQGGYLLLGDKCQAIYDYDCYNGDNINSVDFYKRLDQLLPLEIVRYELMGNQRQTDKLAAISENLRHALLNLSPLEANELIAEELKHLQTIGSVEKFDFGQITKRTAILCRTNGEAEYVSHRLHAKSVPHVLLRSNGQAATLKRFLADCLWDYHADSKITRNAFIQRYSARVSDDSDVASQIFDTLCEAVYENIKDAIEVEKLARTLSQQTTRLSKVILNENDSLLTVSTIHKAKGREFDTVFLLDSAASFDESNTEEARVWYVGCTRAKSDLCRLSVAKLFLKRSSTNNLRWVQLNNHKVKWKQKLMRHCSHLVLGLPMDFADAGFVKGDFYTALKMQEYIAENVKVGDSVEIVLIDEQYRVLHKGEPIGCLGENIKNQLQEIARETNPASNAPPRLSSVFVLNIITITPYQFPDDVMPYFRQSRFWLGVELTGFPKIDWYYGVTNE